MFEGIVMLQKGQQNGIPNNFGTNLKSPIINNFTYFTFIDRFRINLSNAKVKWS